MAMNDESPNTMPPLCGEATSPANGHTNKADRL